MNKPLVKLFKLYALKESFADTYSDNVICMGIWQTNAVFEVGESRVFELACVCPYNSKVQLDEKRKMDEQLMINLCDEITFTRTEITEQ
jgi:hypothetical protein